MSGRHHESDDGCGEEVVAGTPGLSDNLAKCLPVHPKFIANSSSSVLMAAEAATIAYEGR
jgi:hypothetical protein